MDDAAYALAKSQALSSRGYGKRRLDDKLRMAGVGEEDGAAAREHAAAQAVDAAIRFAQRRKIGPFATAQADPKQREKAIGAMVRAGHSFALSRVIADMPAGVEVDMNELRSKLRVNLTKGRPLPKVGFPTQTVVLMRPHGKRVCSVWPRERYGPSWS